MSSITNTAVLTPNGHAYCPIAVYELLAQYNLGRSSTADQAGVSGQTKPVTSAALVTGVKNMIETGKKQTQCADKDKTTYYNIKEKKCKVQGRVVADQHRVACLLNATHCSCPPPTPMPGV